MDTAATFLAIQKEAAVHNAKLVAVVKKREVHKIQTLIDAGATDIAFGTVQEAEAKLPKLRFSGTAHLIGHLQKNKVRKALQLFDVIQSVDSLALAERIDQVAAEEQKQPRLMLQVNIANDADKFGFSVDKLHSALPRLTKLTHATIVGVMMIGRFGMLEVETRNDFRALRQLFHEIKSSEYFGDAFCELSMGMSSDYRLALVEGATLIRVGSVLFSN